MAISLRERRRLMLRDEILQAARVLILERGYIAMSMDDLAAHVGISKPTLYSHFATKEDIVVAGFIGGAERLFTFAETDTANHSPRQRLLMILHAMLQTHSDDVIVAARPFSPDVFHVLCGNKQALGYIQRMEALIGALFQDAIMQGEIAADLNPKAMALAFFSLAHAARAAPFFFGHLDADTLEDTFVAFFERGTQA